MIAKIILLTVSVLAWPWSLPLHAASPEKKAGSDDWMLPSCQRPISDSYPLRPPECDGGSPANPAPAVPSAAGAAVPHAQPASDTPIRVTASLDQIKTVKLARFRTSIRDGQRLGEAKVGLFCNVPVPLIMGERLSQIVLAPVMRPLRDEFVSTGYRDPSQSRGLFDEDADQSRIDLQLGGMLEDMSATYCSTSGGARIEGTARFRIKWQLFDPVARKVVLTKETEGQYRTQGAENIREAEFFGKAYREAIRRLLADQQFHDIVAGAAAAAPTLAEAASAATAPEETTALKKVPVIKGSLAVNMTMLRTAVVTITHATGSGSGFFVAEDGYVLTNSHVVAGQRFVRVRLATGRELVGEVLKQDTGRDVALIRTEGKGFIPLALYSGEVNVGAEVTAIGSPLGEALSGTVTRGIVSGYRTLNSRRYIQSDVSILPGSSGGPLLDSDGRVVGIAVRQLAPAARVNFFIPVGEALSSLGLRIPD